MLLQLWNETWLSEIWVFHYTASKHWYNLGHESCNTSVFLVLCGLTHFNISSSEIFYPIHLLWKFHTNFLGGDLPLKRFSDLDNTPLITWFNFLCAAERYSPAFIGQNGYWTPYIQVQTQWLPPDHPTVCKSDCCSVLRYSSQITKEHFISYKSPSALTLSELSFHYRS